MASFNLNDDNPQRLDWSILRAGGIVLYRNEAFLAEDMNWLKSEGYRFAVFDCSQWNTGNQMHESLKEGLSFPDYYGRNLNALNECMCEDLDVPDTGGLAIVLKQFDLYFRGPGGATCGEGRSEAEVILGIIARASRQNLLFGRRLMALVQTDDPRTYFTNLDAIIAQWNRREWLNRSRGI